MAAELRTNNQQLTEEARLWLFIQSLNCAGQLHGAMPPHSLALVYSPLLFVGAFATALAPLYSRPLVYNFFLFFLFLCCTYSVVFLTTPSERWEGEKSLKKTNCDKTNNVLQTYTKQTSSVSFGHTTQRAGLVFVFSSFAKSSTFVVFQTLNTTLELST